MNNNIVTKKLYEFDKSIDNRNVEFARYAYICGASSFVDHDAKFDMYTDKCTHTYKFKDFYINERFSENLPYFVMYIPKASYLMYEKGEEIFIWVCYTEEEERGKGYIYKLLRHLRDHFPNERVVVDTFDESLKRNCINLGINIFER